MGNNQRCTQVNTALMSVANQRNQLEFAKCDKFSLNQADFSD